MNAIPSINLPNKPCHSQFDDQDWHILAQHWYPVARVEDVTTKPQQVTLLDMNMAIYKTESGNIHLVRDICPHRGVPLSKGWVEGETIISLIMVCISMSKVNAQNSCAAGFNQNF